MQILFITSTRIGDAVLSSGLLNHIFKTYKEAHVTVVCGPLAASLFEGYPNLESIIPLKKQKYNGHWISLWQKTVTKQWDMVIDLRNSAVSRIIPAKQRYIFGRHIDKSRHKVEQNAQVMGLPLDHPPPPNLWFTEQQAKAARKLIGRHDVPVIAIGPTANWRAKTWPAARFIELTQWLLSDASPYPKCKIAIFGAPGEEDDAYKVLNALPTERRIDVIAKANPGTAAAALSLCDLYIGNDSGLMHCAAATDAKTLGLFGPSYPAIYRPWGAHCAYVQTPQTFDELISYEGYTPQTAPCLMEGITVEMVKDTLINMSE